MNVPLVHPTYRKKGNPKTICNPNFLFKSRFHTGLRFKDLVSVDSRSIRDESRNNIIMEVKVLMLDG